MANTFAPKSLERFYQKKHVNHIISGENQMERIFRLSIDDISKEIKRLQSKRLLEPSKFGRQLSRNKALKKQLILMRDNLNRQFTSQLKGEITESWNLANIKNDRLARGYLKGLQVQSAAQYYNVNTKALNNFINRKIKGLSLSEKVWNLSNDTHKLVEDWIATGITQGKSTAKISRDMYKMMGDPLSAKVVNDAGKTIRFSKVSDFVRSPAPKGHYKNPRKSIQRLVRNEINASYRLSDNERYNQLDFVVGVKVSLSAAHGDFDLCDNLKGNYPKTFIFDGWHPNCYSDDTEIMTNQGWKLLKDINGRETIFSLHPETRIPEYTNIVAKFQRPYKGNMIEYKNASLNISVTPDHDMIYLNKSDGVIMKRKASDFDKNKGAIARSCDWVGEKQNIITIGDYKIDFDLFCEFMGYYLSDGSITTTRKYWCVISQQEKHDPETYGKIKKCLEKMPFKFTESGVGFNFWNQTMYEYLGQFKKSFDKYIPKEILNANKDSIEVFLKAFVSCDGHTTKPRPFIGSRGTLCTPKGSRRSYFTSSPVMAGQLGELILKIGKRPSFRISAKKGDRQKFSNGTYTINHDCYVIGECNSKTASVFTKEEIPYDGIVYDLELEKNHIMYLRRNGKCFWGSNCLCFVTSILMTKQEFKSGVFPEKSTNVVKKIPTTTQRYVKTRGAKSKGSSWYDKNFKNNVPLKKVGGASKGIKPYDNMKSWSYESNPDRYLTKAKKGLVNQ